MRQKINVFISLFFLCLVEACGNSSEPEETVLKEIPASTDLKVIETYTYKGSEPKDTYYIYDERNNLEYIFSPDESSSMSTYMLEHYTYDDKNRAVIYQFVYMFDYSAEMEAWGSKDETIYTTTICEYDEKNNKVKEQQIKGKGTYSCVYEYDEMSRLVKENVRGNGEGNSYINTYQYDEDGNMVKKVQTFDTGDEYDTKYEYDSAGKMIKDGKYKLEYDDDGHLIKKYDSSATWTYKYITDPADSMQYIDLIERVFNLDKIEADASSMLAQYFGISEKETKDDKVEVSKDFISGSLPESIYLEIYGHYDDGHNDTVDIESTTSIVRYIGGGNQGHTYDEKICGYSILPNGYFVYVEWDGYTYVYYYTVENGIQHLYVNFDDDWQPTLDHFMKDVQCYVKDGTEVFTENTNVQDDIYDSEYGSWGLDAANEGGLTSFIFDKIKGTYCVEGKDITIRIVSQTKIEYQEGNNKTSLAIDGCDVVDSSLSIYISGNSGEFKDYQNVLMVPYADRDEDLLLLIGSGTWSPSSYNIYAKRVAEDNSSLEEGESDYILPDADKKIYERITLEKLSVEELRLARNEIYARHGRKFKADDLQSYFNSKPWYKPQYEPDEFDALGRTIFSDCENANLDLIIEVEKSKK